MNGQLGNLVLKCLGTREMLSEDVAKELGIPKKAVRMALGHLKKKGIVECESIIIHTPYGDYRRTMTNSPRWRLKK